MIDPVGGDGVLDLNSRVANGARVGQARHGGQDFHRRYSRSGFALLVRAVVKVAELFSAQGHALAEVTICRAAFACGLQRHY